MPVAIQICSGAEWRSTLSFYCVRPDAITPNPFGGHFTDTVADRNCVFFHSRRTKTRAAGACQYAIDHWKPSIVLVLGTCGGVAEELQVHDIVFATRTIQYDCEDQRPDMGLAPAADPSWIDLTRLNKPLRSGTIASADHDLRYEHVQALRGQGVVAADWETGAIAPVCALNRVPWAAFRGVSDSPRAPGESDYQRQLRDYQVNASVVTEELLLLLPSILAALTID